jgi:hypothetical protein
LITYVSGVLSLFIGVSLASLFEMIELISEVIYFFLILTYFVNQITVSEKLYDFMHQLWLDSTPIGELN